MKQAIWNNQVIAESEKTVVIEGNHYFPPDTIKKEFFKSNSTHTNCPWKGVASYYDVEVDGKTKMQHGITLKHRNWQKPSKDMSLFGKELL